MTKKIQKDKRNRQLFKKTELKRITLKTLAKNSNLSPQIRHKINLQLTKMPKNGSITRISNRCIISGRSHGVHKKFKISRILLREYINNGWIPGYKKISW